MTQSSHEIQIARRIKSRAQIAQLVEQRTENPRVTGSIPVLGISYCHKLNMGYGALAQSVEHLTFNQVVGGSNPPCFSRKALYLQGFFLLRVAFCVA